MMKQLIQLITVVLILMFYSCTFPKKDCIEGSADMIQAIYFNNFIQQDLDSVILTSYNPSSNFTSSIDSCVIHAYPYDTLKYFAETGRLIDIHLDYKINIVRTGQGYKLTGFATRRAVCDKQLLYKSYFNKLDSYYVNGKKKTLGFIEIDK